MNYEDLKTLITEKPVGEVINELQNGRNRALPATDSFIKQLDPKLHDVMNAALRPDKKVFLEDDNEDNDPNVISVTGVDEKTGKKYRIEKVARVAIALQKKITNMAAAFTFGNPVILNAEPEENTKEADVLKSVKKVLVKNKTKSLNRRLARILFSSTEVAEIWYIQEGTEENTQYGFKTKSKLKVAVLNPLLGDKLYPYFDETGDMVAFSREYTVEDEQKKKTKYFESYTAEQHFLWKFTKEAWEVVEGFPKKNAIGKIPVIYAQQANVEWADVQNLIDRLEKLLSNFADTNDYHASPKIFVEGEVVGFAKKGDSGGIIQGEVGSKAYYLSWNHAPESVKLEIETLLKLIHSISQTPDVSFDNVKGIGAISGVALQLLFMDALLKVMDKCEIFDDYLQRRISVIQAFLKKMNVEAGFSAACDSLTIEPEITPYMIKDEQALVNLLMQANGQKAVASRKTSVQILGWADDTEAEIKQIEEEENAAAYNSLIEQEPTV